MQRVTNFKQFIGAGTGGLLFKADYTFPDQQSTIEAAIKIMIDYDDFTKYEENIILAILTGNNDVDKYDSSKTRPFSYDKSQNRVEVNRTGTPNPYASCINKFYEIQKMQFDFMGEVSQKLNTAYMTVMVTELGVKDMWGVLFNNPGTKPTNTNTLLRWFLEIARGGRNINAQGILHGDIKPPNMILTRDSNGQLHAEHIDFDLIYDPQNERNPNSQLRYTQLFRAPWIEANAQIKKRNTDQGVVEKTYYTYDSVFREDTYAIAKSMLLIGQKNKDFLNMADERLIKLQDYLENQVIQSAEEGPDNVPTTAELYQFMKEMLTPAPQVIQQAPSQTVTSFADMVILQNKNNEQKYMLLI